MARAWWWIRGLRLVRRAWTGRPWEEAVLYELHVGAATPEGTYAGLMGRLSTCATSASRRSSSCRSPIPGPPKLGLRRRAALRARRGLRHARTISSAGRRAPTRSGSMVFLDVVYNHFGPAGNYLHAYAKTSSPSATRRRGAPASTSMADSAGRCATSSSTTRSTGSRSTTSTACASTPSTPSWTTATAHHRARLRARSAPRFPTAQVHLVLENEANQARWLARDATGAAPAHRPVERRHPSLLARAR